MPDDPASLIVERHGAVAHLTLNRPAVLNALDRDLADRLHTAALAVSADPAIRAVVLKGAAGSHAAARSPSSERPRKRLVRELDMATVLRVARLVADVEPGAPRRSRTALRDGRDALRAALLPRV